MNLSGYFCLTCQTSFSFKNKAAKTERENKIFQGWMRKRTAIQLAEDYGCSARKVSRIIRRILSNPPPSQEIHLEQVQNVVFDGSFLRGRKETVIVLINGSNNKPIDVSFDAQENNKEGVKTFLLGLKENGLNPTSVTIDP